jgi:hypothetical protein
VIPALNTRSTIGLSPSYRAPHPRRWRNAPAMAMVIVKLRLFDGEGT